MLFVLLFGTTMYAGLMTFAAFHFSNRLKSLTPSQLNVSNDDVVNYLEASWDSSPTARTALKLLNEHNQKLDDPDHQKLLPGAVPDWYHDPKAKLPLDKHWELCEADLDRCTFDLEMLATALLWIKAFNFSLYEQDKMISKFENPGIRHEVREAFFNKKTETSKKNNP